jgi:hypothetical protein
MDLGGSKDLDGLSDLDGSSWMLVVLHGCWSFQRFFVGSFGSGWFFRTWLVFSGDTAVFQAYDHSTHILVRAALADVTGKRRISIYFLCIGRA